MGAAVASALSGGAAQVVVADGRSSDATQTIAAATGAEVIEAPRGRARQMNAGAARATGDVLLFLHADTLLPERAAALVRTSLAEPAVVGGAFRYTASGAGLWDPVLTLGNRLRCALSPKAEVVDIIKTGEIGLVVNTPTRGKLKDRVGFILRRATMEWGVPCITSLDTLAALLSVMDDSIELSHIPLHEYLDYK